MPKATSTQQQTSLLFKMHFQSHTIFLYNKSLRITMKSSWSLIMLQASCKQENDRLELGTNACEC